MRGNSSIYEPRFISKTNNTIELFFDESDKQTLKDFVLTNSKTVLLGPPGIGKTRELEELFDQLWDEGIHAHFISLKYFRSSGKFDDLIAYKDWHALPDNVFILDGLDEIADIQDFVSALEIFILQNSTLNIKYVISCRANVYEKYLVDLKGFNAVFLELLSNTQIKSILEKNYEVKLEEDIISKHFLIRTPFFLGLFAEYYKEKEKLPSNDSEIWQRFIDKSLKLHRGKLAKKERIGIPLLLQNLRKLAFVIELTQKNYFTESELYEIFKENYQDIIDNPLVEFGDQDKNLSFTHRQIQEYLVADTLKQLSFEDILNIIKINDVDNIHPTLINAVTFLLNLLDLSDSEYNKLLQWIIINQIEIIFKSDSDRLSKDLRNKVFQEYFTKECIEKKYWINKTSLLSIEEIAVFGDTVENFSYLLDIFNDENHHYRTRISAIELLGNITIPYTLLQKLKNNFLELLSYEEVKPNIKAHIINCIASQNELKDRDYIQDIVSLFCENTNKEINASILFLIKDYRDVDDFFEFILFEFLLENKIVKRDDEDKVIRGNSFVLEELILALNNSDNLIKLVSYFFRATSGYSPSLDNTFEKKLYERLLYFANTEDQFIRKLFESIGTDQRLYFNERFLAFLVLESNRSLDVFSYLINNSSLKKEWYFLGLIANEESMWYLNSLYLKKDIIESEEKEITKIRNIINNNGQKDLARKYEAIFKDSGYSFDSELAELDKQYLENSFQNQVQKEFDALFDKIKLIQSIDELYEEQPNLNIRTLIDLEQKWFKINGAGSYLPAHYSVMHDLFYKNENLNKADVIALIEKGHVQYDMTRKILEQFRSSQVKVFISEEQKTFLIDGVRKLSDEFDFNDVISLWNDNGSFAKEGSYSILKSILFYDDLFDIKLSKEFYLKITPYYNLETFNEDDYESLKKKVNDEERFNKQIVENILGGNLFELILFRHVKYAIKNKLNNVYDSIRDSILKTRMFESDYKVLKEFYDWRKDKDFLVSCCTDNKSWLYWTAVKVLDGENLEQSFLIDLARKYLQQADSLFYTNALNILLKHNTDDAIDYLLKFLSNKTYISISRDSYSKYSNRNNINKLEDIYFTIYGGVDKDEFSSYDYRSFYEFYIRNLCSDESSFYEVKKILTDIQKEINSTGGETFYINHLIDAANDSYIYSKSQPLTLREAINKANQIFI